MFDNNFLRIVFYKKRKMAEKYNKIGEKYDKNLEK
jgi:hypothetical protein